MRYALCACSQDGILPQQILTYWFIAQIIGLAGLPLARLVVGALPAAGYPFAKPLGLLMVGYLAWLLAMLGLAPFGTGLVIACIVAVALLGGLSHAEGHPRAIWAWLRANWRTVVMYEIIFTAAFVYLAVQRSYEWGFIGPNPWGTERPMDFAFFNAIQRSATFPPHDPWMAGFSINYYYLGYLLMASVALLGGLPAGVSYNLSLALLFALAAQGIAGMVVTLVRVARPQAIRSGWAVALLSVVLVLGVGNQGGALQVISGTEKILALEGRDMLRLLVNGVGNRATVTLDPPFRGADFEGTTEIVPSDQIKDFNWWNSSRALWDSFPDENGRSRQYAITEFPFFSFWLGDMHPHVMALPFGLLAMALALHVVVRPEMPTYGQGRKSWVELLTVGAVLGGLYAINSWDLPVYLLLFLIAIFLRAVRDTHDTKQAIAWRTLGIQVLLVVFVAFALYVPFHLTFRSLVGGKAPLVDIPLLATASRTLGIVAWSKTPLQTFMIIFGLFLVPLLGWMTTNTLDRKNWYLPWVVMLVTLLIGIGIGFPLLVLAPLAAYSFMAAIERSREGFAGESFALAMFALCCAICFGTEIIYIRDTFENRMNTIFKFYYQVWLIWGTLAGYGLWRVLVAAPVQQQAPHSLMARLSLRFGQILTILLFLPLLAGALVYPILTLSKLYGEGTQIGLNGTNPRERDPDGAAAIAWLRQNVSSESVILEPTDGGYDTGGLGLGGVSSSTGLAAVMGWTGHQRQWRGGDPSVLDQIEPRRQDVDTIYTTLDSAQARDLLSKYKVRYIYVGPTERAAYSPDALAKFDQIGTVAFQQGAVTIYAVGQ